MSVSYRTDLEENQIEGIILRTFPYGDADLVLRLLSPTGGKRSLIAKGARKEKSKFKVNLDVFDCGRFEVRPGKGSLETLVDFKPLQTFSRIRSDIDTFIIASVIAETFDHLVHDHTPDGDSYYESLHLGLSALSEAKETREALKACYLTLYGALGLSGFGVPHTEAASLKGLLLLIDRIEQSCEKQFTTKSSLIELLNRWRRAA